jgi:G3E family GTPase
MTPGRDSQPKKLPVSILTGFLGAGKTTLLNKLLKSEQASKTGVLVNDFGEIDIDSQIIESLTDGAVSLRNGCICCTLRVDFVDAIDKLMTRANPPERLVVETSGVSDPRSIIDTLTHPALAQTLRVDSVVTVVDASELLSLGEDERRLAEAQIGPADMVVINKADLADEKTLTAVDERVREIVPSARLFRTNHGDVPWSLLFAEERTPTGSAAVPTVGERNRPIGRPGRTFLAPTRPFKLSVFRRRGGSGRAHDHCGDHSCECSSHPEREQPGPKKALTEAFESASAVIERPLALDRLREVLRTLPRDIYRLKGLFHVDLCPDQQILIQVVGDRVNEIEVHGWGEKPRRSEVVAIGLKGRVSSSALRRLLESCAVEAERPLAAGFTARFMSWLRGRSLPTAEERKVASENGKNSIGPTESGGGRATEGR